MDSLPSFILETDRIWLREFCSDDAHAFARIVCDPKVMQFIGPCPASLEEAAKHLEERPIADYRKHGFGRWAVVLKENGKVIGWAGLKFNEDIQEVDLGFSLLPEYWGRGLAVEAGRAIVSYGFETLRLKRIIGLVDGRNTRSIRAYKARLHL